MGRFRDDELCSMLRSMETPEHAPGFEDDVLALVTAGEAEAPSPAPGGPAADRARSWWRRLAWAPIPLAAAALVAFWALGGLDSGPLGPQVASAAEVKAKVVSALAAVERMRGVLVVVAADGAGTAEANTETVVSDGAVGRDGGAVGTVDEMRWRFATTSRGDLRLTGLTRAEDLAYDATRGAQQAVSGGRDGEPVVASEATGLAAGPPDPGPADWVLQRSLGSMVRAMLASDDPSVVETTFDGRPAWILATTVARSLLSGEPPGVDLLEVTVDKATGFPVRTVRSRDGAVVEETRIEGLELDPVLPEGTFALSLPAGVEVDTFDNGFLRMDLPEVEAVVGYAPLVPGDLPAGYELSEVTVAAEGQPTGKEGMNPPSGGVVSLAFRRGLDRIVVSTRLTGDDPAAWTDPLSSGEGYIDTPTAVTLAGGALDGGAAEVLVSPLVTPHLWARGDGLVLTVAGDASEAELLRIAQSLRPWAATE